MGQVEERNKREDWDSKEKRVSKYRRRVSEAFGEKILSFSNIVSMLPRIKKKQNILFERH